MPRLAEYLPVSLARDVLPWGPAGDRGRSELREVTILPDRGIVMRIRGVALGVTALVLTLLPATAATAAPVAMPIKGTIVTTIGNAGTGEDCVGGQLLTIVTNDAVHVSTVSGLGRVRLVQVQCVVASTVQPGLVPVPATGTIRVLSGTITAANGDELRFQTGEVPFATFEPPYPATPLPIAFDGTMTFTGGTGRFAHASGTAEFSGSYCFMLNGGMFTFSGRLTR